MKSKDLKVILTTAALTAALVVPIAWPGHVTAVSEDDPARTVVDNPTFKVDGCDVSVRSAKPGDPSKLVVTVHNPSKRKAKMVASLQLVVVGNGPRMARMAPRPTVEWKKKLVAKLAPGETKVLKRSTKVKLGRGSRAMLRVVNGDETHIAASWRMPWRSRAKLPPPVMPVAQQAAPELVQAQAEPLVLVPQRAVR